MIAASQCDMDRTCEKQLPRLKCVGARMNIQKLSLSIWRKACTFGLPLVGTALVLTACNSKELYSSANSSASSSVANRTSQSALAFSPGDLQVVQFLPPPASAGSGNDALISADDVLDIDVFQVDDLDRTVRVESNCTISLPLVGEVKAAGLTLSQLERSLKARYGQNYLPSPEISVFMKESAGQKVTMEGQFLKPGIYPTNSRSSLLQTVSQAGGLTQLADEDKIFVYRTYPEGKKVANYSIANIRKGAVRDPRIYGSDVVVAFTSGAKVARQNLKEALGLAVSATRIASPI